MAQLPIVSYIVGLSLSMLLSMGLILHPTLAAAAPPSAVTDPTKGIDPKIIENPPTLTTQEETVAKNIALSNGEVQKALAGKAYKIEGIGFIGNAYETPIKWNPIVTINVSGKAGINVTVDLATHTIINIEQFEITKIGPQVDGSSSPNSSFSTQSASNPSYSTDYYTGTTNPVEMFMSTQNGAPTYTPSAASMDGEVDFLLNADEYQATGLRCDPSNVYAGYFAQIGFTYPAVGQAKITYSDTLSSCGAINLGLTYTPGHFYTFRIHAYSGPVSWRMIGQDVNTGTVVMSPARTGMQWYLIQAGSANTSVWLENWNSPSSTSWNARFSTDIQGYANYYDGAYRTWPSDQQYDKQCTTFYSYPHSTPPQVMSGSLKNGGTVTWSNYNMAHYIYGCA